MKKYDIFKIMDCEKCLGTYYIINSKDLSRVKAWCLEKNIIVILDLRESEIKILNKRLGFI